MLGVKLTTLKQDVDVGGLSLDGLVECSLCVFQTAPLDAGFGAGSRFGSKEDRVDHACRLCRDRNAEARQAIAPFSPVSMVQRAALPLAVDSILVIGRLGHLSSSVATSQRRAVFSERTTRIDFPSKLNTMPDTAPF